MIILTKDYQIIRSNLDQLKLGRDNFTKFLQFVLHKVYTKFLLS